MRTTSSSRAINRTPLPATHLGHERLAMKLTSRSMKDHARGTAMRLMHMYAHQLYTSRLARGRTLRICIKQRPPLSSRCSSASEGQQTTYNQNDLRFASTSRIVPRHYCQGVTSMDRISSKGELPILRSNKQHCVFKLTNIVSSHIIQNCSPLALTRSCLSFHQFTANLATTRTQSLSRVSGAPTSGPRHPQCRHLTRHYRHESRT